MNINFKHEQMNQPAVHSTTPESISLRVCFGFVPLRLNPLSPRSRPLVLFLSRSMGFYFCFHFFTVFKVFSL